MYQLPTQHEKETSENIYYGTVEFNFYQPQDQGAVNPFRTRAFIRHQVWIQKNPDGQVYAVVQYGETNDVGGTHLMSEVSPGMYNNEQEDGDWSAMLTLAGPVAVLRTMTRNPEDPTGPRVQHVMVVLGIDDPEDRFDAALELNNNFHKQNQANPSLEYQLDTIEFCLEKGQITEERAAELASMARVAWMFKSN